MFWYECLSTETHRNKDTHAGDHLHVYILNSCWYLLHSQIERWQCYLISSCASVFDVHQGFSNPWYFPPDQNTQEALQDLASCDVWLHSVVENFVRVFSDVKLVLTKQSGGNWKLNRMCLVTFSIRSYEVNVWWQISSKSSWQGGKVTKLNVSDLDLQPHDCSLSLLHSFH